MLQRHKSARYRARPVRVQGCPRGSEPFTRSRLGSHVRRCRPAHLAPCDALSLRAAFRLLFPSLPSYGIWAKGNRRKSSAESPIFSYLNIARFPCQARHRDGKLIAEQPHGGGYPSPVRAICAVKNRFCCSSCRGAPSVRILRPIPKGETSYAYHRRAWKSRSCLS